MQTTSLPIPGFSRIGKVLELIPVSRAKWYQGIKSGVYPKPVKLFGNAAAWRNEDLLRLIEKIESEHQNPQEN